ncbi:TonB-dependent outer membrane receptor [Bacillus subtilis subsp. subtilis]|nr:TonB-dependent outer membrane receptor [Bacillus subtilis subsp. subtilis]
MQFDDTGAQARPQARLWGALIAALIAVLGHVLPSVAAADAGDTTATRHFDIPAQPLPQALQLYGETTGVAVLIDAHLLGGLRSTPVKGTQAPLAALQTLLQGTGLVPRFVDGAAFTLVPADAGAAAPSTALPTPASSAVPAHAARVLQQSLEQALCGDRATRPGRYRAALQLWWDEDRSIARVELLESSGDPARDNAIVARLRGLALPGLPAGLPQPVTMLLLPRSAAATVPCKGRP